MPDDLTRTHIAIAAGSMIQHYRIVEKIGAGGMGEVYLAEDSRLNRKVALKFLPVHQAQDAELRGVGERLLGPLRGALGPGFAVEIIECASQIGSGALPLETIPSVGISIGLGTPKASGRTTERLAAAFRKLAIPVIGRIEKGALVFDLRCLDDEASFIAQLDAWRAAFEASGPVTT